MPFNWKFYHDYQAWFFKYKHLLTEEQRLNTSVNLLLMSIDALTALIGSPSVN